MQGGEEGRILIAMDLGNFMKNAFDRATRAYKINSLYFKISESLVAVVAGGFVGVAIEHKSLSLWTVVFFSLFAVTQIIKFTLEGTVGESVLKELWSAHKLEQLQRESQRTCSNFERIRRSIVSLNERTCTIEKLCDQGFPAYMRPMLDACFDNPNELLCTKDAKIYVEIYCKEVLEIADKFALHHRPLVFVYRDDFGEVPDEDDFEREINEVRERASQTNRFSNYKTQFSKRADRIIACPIPTVCEDGNTLGAIVIAANLCEECCDNLREVLSIFSRVVANSLIKYNDCVTARCAKEKLEVVPEALS